jgi:coenzyme F420-dependent glucose-6-phosphate dehydrogenase
VTRIGYTLSCEEQRPSTLVGLARRAEEAGFPFALISDHFHPWTDRQGQSPFVWGVLGGIATSTKRIRVGTGVTCPTIRIHPAIVAHASATAAAMMPGRFFLGVGSGENLNEHVHGDRWPPAKLRLEMLEEAVGVIRCLWRGGLRTHRGRHYTVENARLYTLPPEPPPIMVAASGAAAAELAGRVGDGMIGTAPEAETVRTFLRSGGEGKPRIGQLHVCWAETEELARRTALEVWPNGALQGNMFLELPLPEHFEQAARLVGEPEIAESVLCGPDPERHLDAIEEYARAGYDHVYLHQIGEDQEGFFRFFERELGPRLQRSGLAEAA